MKELTHSEIQQFVTEHNDLISELFAVLTEHRPSPEEGAMCMRWIIGLSFGSIESSLTDSRYNEMAARAWQIAVHMNEKDGK